MDTTNPEATDWVAVCPADDLEPWWGEACLVAGRQIALFALPDGRIFAVAHHDPRTGAPVMARGIVGSKGDRVTVASPLYKEVYDLATGECLSGSPHVLATFATLVADGVLHVAVAVRERLAA